MKQLAACCVCLWATGCAHRESARTDELPNTIRHDKESVSVSVESFQYQLPQGLLGVPLGTVARVTGEAVDGSTYRRKAAFGKIFLRILSVDGRKLATSVEFEFEGAPDAVKKPAPGDKFDYYVHEYGEWSGVVEPPEELGIGASGLAHDGFHYRPHLRIYASNAVPK